MKIYSQLPLLMQKYTLRTSKQAAQERYTNAHFPTLLASFSRSTPILSAHFRLRHTIADTFAMMVYCTAASMTIGIFLSGMTFRRSLSSRLVAILINIIIAVPYGFYRDSAIRQARRISPAGWTKSMADVLAYATFRSPVYIAILQSVGVNWRQIVTAMSPNLTVSMMVGAVCDYFPDYYRRLSRITPYQQAKVWPTLFQRLALPVTLSSVCSVPVLSHRINLSISPVGFHQIIYSKNAQAPPVS